MYSIQKSLGPEFWTSTGRSWSSLHFELREMQNDGNWPLTIRAVNDIIGRMAVRMAKAGLDASKKADLSKFYFVNCPIGVDAWGSIEEAFPTADIVFASLGSLLVDGFKVSFSLNPQNDMTVCSITDKREGSVSVGACLTGGADGWYDALRVCLYKYEVVLQGDLTGKGSYPNGNGRIS